MVNSTLEGMTKELNAMNQTDASVLQRLETLEKQTQTQNLTITTLQNDDRLDENDLALLNETLGNQIEIDANQTQQIADLGAEDQLLNSSVQSLNSTEQDLTSRVQSLESSDSSQDSKIS